MKHGIWIALTILMGCAEPSPPANPPPSGALPDDVRPTAYRLELDIDPRAPRFAGNVVIAVEFARTVDGFWIHGRDLDVEHIELRQGDEVIGATYRQLAPEGVARVQLARAARAGAAELRVTYDAPFSAGAEGLYRVEVDGAWYAFTQFEPIDARRVFPGFDEPGHKTPYDIVVRVAGDDVAIASAAQTSNGLLADGRREVAFARTAPLPSYLIAFAVGPLDVIEAGTAGGVPLRGIAARGRGALMERALRETPLIVARLEDYFGVPYPFDKLDLIAVPGQLGAMENVGAITYAEDLILLDKDAPRSQLRDYTVVHIHELAHQWFGNYVTMRWWDDLWLNEAFADWIADRIAGELHPDFGYAADAVRAVGRTMGEDGLASTRRVREPALDFNDIMGAFDSMTYAKGAAVLSMLERFVGEDTFRSGIQRYMANHALGSASVDDLAAALTQAADNPALAGALRSFIDQPGVPQLTVTRDCDAAGNALTISQRRYLPLGSRAVANATWQIPICVRMSGAGEPLCQMLTQREMRIALGAQCPAWLMPNADAKGYYRFSLPGDVLATLLSAMGDLTAEERIALSDSLMASIAAGALPVTALFDRIDAFAQAAERQLVTAPLPIWTQLDRYALQGDALAASRARRAQVYGAALAAARAAPSVDTTLEAQLIGTLAIWAKDAGTRRELDNRARRFVGFETGPADAAALPQDWIDVALVVAVQDTGAAFVDHLVARLPQVADPNVRGGMLRAIASATDPAAARALLDDPSTRGNELFILSGTLLAPERIDTNAAWMVEHLMRELPRYPTFGHRWLIGSFGNRCSVEGAAALPRQLSGLMDRLEGGPRALAQTVEQMELCAAFVAHHGVAANHYFSRGVAALTGP